MPDSNSYGDHLKEWETTLTALQANAGDLPQLEWAANQLSSLITELREHLAEQALHRANKQESSKRLLATFNQGKKITTSVRAVLKVVYGNTNERLVEFGIQPRRTRSRKPVPDPEPEPQPQPQPESNGPTPPPVE